MENADFTLQKEHSIKVPEITALDLPYCVKQESNDFYMKVFEKRRRGKNRKMTIVFTIYQTYLNRGEYFDIVHLGKMLKLNESDSNASISVCLKTSSLYDLPDIHIGQVDPVAMIDYYCGDRVLNIDEEEKQQIIEIYNSIVGESCISQEGKKSTVAACVYYWIRLNSLAINETVYRNAFPGVTMNKIEDLSFKISCLLQEH